LLGYLVFIVIFSPFGTFLLPIFSNGIAGFVLLQRKKQKGIKHIIISIVSILINSGIFITAFLLGI